jgi:hypothetical protein
MTPQIWTETEKDKMREAAEWHMADEGYRKVWSVTIDEVGDDIETWTQAASPTPCGIEAHEGRENKSDLTTTTYEITIRLPVGFEIDQKDHFLITSFRGDVVSWEYEITTPIQAGVSAIRFGARKIEH